jgi:hypothetical protein
VSGDAEARKEHDVQHPNKQIVVLAVSLPFEVDDRFALPSFEQWVVKVERDSNKRALRWP